MIKHMDGLIILPTAFVMILFVAMAAVILALLIALMRKEDALERLRARHYRAFDRDADFDSYEYISIVERYGEEIMSHSKDETDVSAVNT